MGQGHGKYRPRQVDPVAYLAETYFHQDYDLEAETPLGVVQNFLDGSGEEDAWELRRALVRLLSEPGGDARLAEAWLVKGGAEYDPRRDGVSLREWFQSIIDLVDGRG